MPSFSSARDFGAIYAVLTFTIALFRFSLPFSLSSPSLLPSVSLSVFPSVSSFVFRPSLSLSHSCSPEAH